MKRSPSLSRILKQLKAVGKEVTQVIIGNDGSVTVLTSADESSLDDSLNAARRQRANNRNKKTS